MIDLDDPDEIDWSRATRTRYPIYGYWAFLAGRDPDPRPIVTCRDLTRRALTLNDAAEALRRNYAPGLRIALERSAPLFDWLPPTRRRRWWWKPWTWRR